MSDTNSPDRSATEARMRADIQSNPEYARRVLARLDAGAPLDCTDEEFRLFEWEKRRGDLCSLCHLPPTATNEQILDGVEQFRRSRIEKEEDRDLK